MTTDGGRQTVKYLVRCALAAGDSLTKQDQNGVSYTFPGGMNLCPAWKNGGVHGTNFRTCQNLVSACMMAHVNTAGVHIPIWMASEAPQIGWGLDLVNYPKQEGTFFGNIIETGDLTQMGMAGVTGPVAYFCEGAGFADGTVQGRLGVGQSGANLPYRNQYGGTCEGNGNFVGHCSDGSGGGQPADGYKTAYVNSYMFQNGEPITVWRNPNTSSGGTSSTTIPFSPSYSYRLMPKHVSGKSVDVAYGSTKNGTAVQQWGPTPTPRRSSPSSPAARTGRSRCRSTPTSASARPTTAPGTATAMEIQDCNGGATQAWTVTLVSGTTDTFNFKNKASNRCLDVQGAYTYEGARMQIWDCNGGGNQKFAVNVN